MFTKNALISITNNKGVIKMLKKMCIICIIIALIISFSQIIFGGEDDFGVECWARNTSGIRISDNRTQYLCKCWIVYDEEEYYWDSYCGSIEK